MKIVLAPDKFKGSLSAQEVCTIAASTLSSIFPQAKITQLPMADGGEGTSAVLGQYFGAEIKEVHVQDPLMRQIKAVYYYSKERKEAYIEMANASGLQLLKQSELQGLLTNTLGTGEMIHDAFRQGAKQLILCIGGSATNEAGTGMASALGYKFLNKHGDAFIPNGKTLAEITEIIPPAIDFRQHLKTTILSDVNNPLLGKNGAAYIYGPQKGLSKADCECVDQGLHHLTSLIQQKFKKDIAHFAGAGAAGGLGGGASFFLNAEINPGAAYISQLLQLESTIPNADLVITGEGKLDEQSLQGKVVSEVYRICKKHEKKLLIVTGKNELGNEHKSLKGVDIISLSENAINQEEAMNQASKILKESLLRYFD